MGHNKPLNLLLAVMVVWLIILSAGPMLVELIKAAVPLAIVVGVVLIILRLLLIHSQRW